MISDFIFNFPEVGLKFLIALVTVFTFFLVICFLVYREALATQRAVEYKPEDGNLDTIDMVLDYTE